MSILFFRWGDFEQSNRGVEICGIRKERKRNSRRAEKDWRTASYHWPTKSGKLIELTKCKGHSQPHFYFDFVDIVLIDIIEGEGEYDGKE